MIWARRACCATRATPSWRASIGLRDRRPARRVVRPGRRRRRAGGARGRGLRRVGGARDRRRSTRSRPAARPATSSRIENYLGFPAGHLRRRARRARDDPGAQVRRAHRRARPRPSALEHARRPRRRAARRRARSSARAVVIATGRPLPQARGPAAGASSRERRLLRGDRDGGARCAADDPVVVVGGGNSAGQATVFLARARVGGAPVDPRRRPRREHVALPRRPHRARRRASRSACTRRCGSSLGDDRARGASWSRTSATASGDRDRRPRAVRLHRRRAAHRAGSAGRSRSTSHGFVLHRAARSRAGGRGPIRSCSRRAAPAIFAAGDVRCGSVKRVASAVGEGAMAVQLVHRHLAARELGQLGAAHALEPGGDERAGVEQPAHPAVAAVGVRLVVDAPDRREDAAVEVVPLLDLVVAALDVGAEALEVARGAAPCTVEPGVAWILARVDAAQLEQVVLDLSSTSASTYAAASSQSGASPGSSATSSTASPASCGAGDRRHGALGQLLRARSPGRARARGRAGRLELARSRARRRGRGRARPPRRGRAARRRPPS